MRSSKSPEEFFHAMKKKPALQKILDNIDSYTDEELTTIKGQPKWIRDRLIEYKNRGGKSSSLTAEQIADQMMLASPQPTGPIQYDVYEWVMSTWKMPCGRFTSVTIDVEPGDLLMYQNNNGYHQLFLSSSRGTLNDQDWETFKKMARYVDKMDRTEYSKAMSNRNSQKNPTIINQAADKSWFTIQRH